jgi:hypothetical protein
MAERMARQFKQLFVTRNELQALEEMLPEQTAHFVKEVDSLNHQLSLCFHKIEANKARIADDGADVSRKLERIEE